MAAESYHKYKDRSIWIKDALLELYLHFLLETWDNSIAEYYWMYAVREDYELNAKGVFPDMMSLSLTKLLTNQEQIRAYMELLIRTNRRINEFAPHLSIHFLDELCNKYPLWPKRTRVLPTADLIQVGDTIATLIS